MLRFLSLSLAAGGLWLGAADDAWSRHYLNNEGLVQLARAGYGERFLIELVQGQPTRFDTSVEGLVYLAKNGVSERMVRMMIAAKKRADDAEEAEFSSLGVPAAGAAPVARPTSAPASAAQPPLRLRTVKRKVLMPDSMAQTRPGDQLIVLDPRWVELR